MKFALVDSKASRRVLSRSSIWKPSPVRVVMLKLLSQSMIYCELFDRPDLSVAFTGPRPALEAGRVLSGTSVDYGESGHPRSRITPRHNPHPCINATVGCGVHEPETGSASPQSFTRHAEESGNLSGKAVGRYDDFRWNTASSSA